MNYRRLQPSESADVLQWISERHYRECTPPGFVFALEFLNGAGRAGAMLIGHPEARGFYSNGYSVKQMLELTRVCFVDETPHCTESNALATMRKFVRTWFPQIRLLLAYSDPQQGHRGTIYESDGWMPFGLTNHKNGKGWQSREGRESTQSWPKQRWVRTP